MKNWLAAGLIVLAFGSCEKDNKGSNNSASGGDFSSYIAYDVNGNQLEYVNDVSDDYKDEDWPQWVYDLFTPLDTVNLEGFQRPNALNVRALYPNPCRDTQTFAVFTERPVNLKIAVVDKNRTRYLLKTATVYLGQQRIPITYNTALMPGGMNYRLFYAFSYEGNRFFKRGHIDLAKQ